MADKKRVTIMIPTPCAPSVAYMHFMALKEGRETRSTGISWESVSRLRV